MNLGLAIKIQRTRKEKTQAQIADAVDCTTNYISLIEHNDREPSLTMLGKLAEAMNTTVSDIMREAELL